MFTKIFLAAAALMSSAVPSSAQLETFWHGPRTGQTVALTFDDAPFEPHTARILKILDQYRVHSTFFVVGKHARTWPETLQSILKKGHEIANHTEMHTILSGQPVAVIKTEILSLQSYLQSTCGIRPRFFRPPQGSVSFETLRVLNDAGMDLIFWDVDPQDWTAQGPVELAKKLADHVRPGNIILLHTLKPETVDMLPILLEYLKMKQLRAVPLSELLGRSAYLF